MQKVRIYTTRICPYCMRAKALLKKKNVPYTDIDVSFDAALRERMIAEAGGARTVPQIFVGDIHVGGCDELYALDKAGKLDPLLAS
jgi:glutaredoxin 3